VIAYDGEQALRILEEPWFRPDFIILDLNLPKVDGHTILERHKTLDGPPVIVFTGSARVDDRRRALANGAKDYVVKPVDFRQFTKVVQEIVERWGNSTEVSPAENESTA
jgi:two-component system response regulator ResD